MTSRRARRRSWGWSSRWWALLPASRRGRRTAFAGLAAGLLLLVWSLQANGRTTWPRDAILAAIRAVESGNRDDVPDGDGGLAIGPYQIHHVYWRDALAHAPALGGSYQDCRRRAYAEAVIDAYMTRWARDAWARGCAETIARTHNGGPDGATKASTLAYWERVRSRLP